MARYRRSKYRRYSDGTIGLRGEAKYDVANLALDDTNEVVQEHRKVYHAFGSPEEFASACERVGVDFSASNWKSGESSETALSYVRNGDDKRVKQAEEICDQFNSEIDLGQSMPQWEVDVCGAYPNVANFLAGVPETMWRKQNVQTDKAPIVIWVCVTSSGGCDAKQMEARGIAIQALAMALGVTRQVKIRIFSGLDGNKRNHVVSIDLPTPAVLSQAAYMLSSQGFSRGLTYEYLYKATGAGGGWPDDIVTFGSMEDRVRSWRKLLPIAREDMVFPHVYMGDPDYENPIEYCKAVFDKATLLARE